MEPVGGARGQEQLLPQRGVRGLARRDPERPLAFLEDVRIGRDLRPGAVDVNRPAGGRRISLEAAVLEVAGRERSGREPLERRREEGAAPESPGLQSKVPRRIR
jgi:hypothetical protein